MINPDEIKSNTNLSNGLNIKPEVLPTKTSAPIPSVTEPLVNKPPSMPKFGAEATSYYETLQPRMAELARTEGELKKFEMQNEAEKTKNQFEATKVYKTNVDALNLTAEQKENEYPRPEFHPTKENLASLGALFSMVSTLGMLVGASGKMGANNAMNAMTGMLKGWQSGRKDLYEKEIKEFDKEYKRITDIRNEIQKKLEKSIALESTNKELAFLERESARQLAGSDSVMGLTIARQGAMAGIDVIKGAFNIDAQYKKIESDAKNRAEDRALRLQQFELRYGGGRGAATKLQEYFPNLSFAGTPSQNETKRESINSGALALVTAQELQEYARQHPNQLGRQGQIQQNVDRYLNSWKAGKSFEEMADDGQPALIFAKRYAAYLVAYERSLAGSNKAMTVSFQNRFNKLMSQDQFNAKGFDDLMNEQMSEVAKATTSKDPAITGLGLLNYGNDIFARAKLPTTESPKNLTPEQINQLRSQAEASIAGGKPEEAVRKRFKDLTGKEL